MYRTEPKDGVTYTKHSLFKRNSDMSEETKRTSIEEWASKLETCMVTHRDEWIELTNLIHTYLDSRPVTLSDVVLKLDSVNNEHTFDTPFIQFNYSKLPSDVVDVKVSIKGSTIVLPLNLLSTYYQYGDNAPGIDRDTVKDILGRMSTTLCAYEDMYRVVHPWLLLRNKSNNSKVEEDDYFYQKMEEERKELDLRKYGPDSDSED